MQVAGYDSDVFGYIGSDVQGYIGSDVQGISFRLICQQAKAHSFQCNTGHQF